MKYQSRGQEKDRCAMLYLESTRQVWERLAFDQKCHVKCLSGNTKLHVGFE